MMRVRIFSGLLILLMFSSLFGCAPVRDAAGKISGDFGEVSDGLGKERHIGSGEEAIVVHPQADKKVKMTF